MVPVYVMFGVSLLLWKYTVAVPMVIVFIMYVIYSLFYTTFPKPFLFFYAAGLATGVYNWFFPSQVLLFCYGGLALLECIRVNLMAILKYPKTIKELHSFTEELEQRVEDRTLALQRSNEQLQHANEELKELDRMKSAFVSQASHDLRTPLTAIKGSLDNLALGVAGELTEKQFKILGRATRSVDRLANLVDDILDLNRIESGRTVLEKTFVSFRTLVQNCMQENHAAAEQKRIALTVGDIEEPFLLYLDQGKMERVVGELIGNAIKYTPEGGSIHVQVQASGDCTLLTVRDSGIGLMPDECAKIWDRFYRTISSQKMAKGTGLGLSIAKELVELHGGTLTVESEPGKGTVFTLALPMNREEGGNHGEHPDHDRG